MQTGRVSVSAIVSAVSSIAITLFWMASAPGYEPLLTLVGLVVGLGGAALLQKSNLPKRFDWLLAGSVAIITLTGIFYLNRFELSGNSEPIIHSLSANPAIVRAGESAIITAAASDQDNDPLAYIWSAQQGTVPNGSPGYNIIYTAPVVPSNSIDIVGVLVSDGRGGVDNADITIVIQN